MEHWTRKMMAVLAIGLMALAGPACGEGGEDEEEEEDSIGLVSSGLR